jgi:pimeloyl-ACP methyl ester carboxylesterase
MLVDLVHVTATDGVRLHGALEMPPTGSSPVAIDVWLCLHGTGSNFYAGAMLGGLTPKLLAAGSAVLRANTRGHDIVCTGPSTAGHSLLGAAFERVSEATLDIAAWLKLLSERGYQRVGLLGHSLGAIKAIFALAAEDAPQVAALVAASPPRLSFEHFSQSRRGPEFLKNFAEAEQLVALGKADELMLVQFPIAYYVTAAGFVDRYGPAERYNILRMLDRVTCPTLMTYGSSEVQAHDAFRGMPEAVEKCATEQNRLQTAVIAGADHQYTGCYDTLAARINKWAARLG